MVDRRRDLRGGPSRRVAVVTGAARGIGKALAISLAEDGYDLVIAARSTADHPSTVLPGTLADTEAAIRAVGGQVVALRVDLTDESAREALAEETLDRFGRCDVLVHNAAVSFAGGFADLPPSRWRKLLEVNLVAPIALTQRLLPALAKGNGVVVSYSSRAATSDEFGLLAYSVSKSAIERLTSGLAAEELGARFVTLRIDDVVRTEAVDFHGGPVHDDALTVADVVDATRWLIANASAMDGRTLSLLEHHGRRSMDRHDPR